MKSKDIGAWRDRVVEGAKANLSFEGHLGEFALVMSDESLLGGNFMQHCIPLAKPDPGETAVIMHIDCRPTADNVTGVLQLILPPEQAKVLEATQKSLLEAGIDDKNQFALKFLEQVKWDATDVMSKGLKLVVDQTRALAYIYVCVGYLQPNLTLGPVRRDEAVPAISVYLEAPGYRSLVMVPFRKTEDGQVEYKDRVDFGKVGGSRFTGLLDVAAATPKNLN